jgi:hypothetical protein
MVCRYEVATMASRMAMAMAMWIEMLVPVTSTTPAIASAKRISSVA